MARKQIVNKKYSLTDLDQMIPEMANALRNQVRGHEDKIDHIVVKEIREKDNGGTKVNASIIFKQDSGPTFADLNPGVHEYFKDLMTNN